MSQKKWGWIVVVVLVLVVNIAFFGRRFWFSPLSEADRRENQEISDAFRNEAMIRKGEEIDKVGNLVRGETWIALQLTERQKFALRELCALVNEARILSWKAEAEPYNGAPARRRHDIARRDKNRLLAIVHARHLVTEGLLTEEQAAYMVQHYLNGTGWNSVYEGSVQDLIAVTPSQESAIAQLGDDLRTEATKTIMPVAFSRGKRAEESYKKLVNDSLARQDLAVRKILTPVQLEKWSRLAAKRQPPTAIPDSRRSSPSDAEAAAVVIEDVSPTFCALAQSANPLGLDADQIKLVWRLKEVTQLGLIWIRREHLEAKSTGEQGSQKSNNPFAQTPEQFLKHAEQVALLGILAEQQAEEVRAVVKQR